VLIGACVQGFRRMVPRRTVRKIERVWDYVPGILMVGWQGAGKTSFYNDVLTLLGEEDKVVRNAGSLGNGLGHGTTELTCIPFEEQGFMVSAALSADEAQVVALTPLIVLVAGACSCGTCGA
jgi:hypothetical protein